MLTRAEQRYNDRGFLFARSHRRDGARRPVAARLYVGGWPLGGGFAGSRVESNIAGRGLPVTRS